MSKNQYLILSLFSTFTLSLALEPIPDYLKICHKSDPNLDKCIIQSVENIRPLLKTGIPSLDIPSVEPIVLGDLLVSEQGQTTGLRITVKDLKAYGPASFVINKLVVIKYGEVYHLETVFPQVYATGIYSFDGKILVLPLRSSGTFHGNFTNISATCKIVFDRKSDDDNVAVKKIDIKAKIEGGRVTVSNLFNGDKVLGQTINEVINQNFDLLAQEIIPLIQKSLERRFKRIATKIVRRYTYAQLFPE